jgi:hypothetical protein
VRHRCKGCGRAWTVFDPEVVPRLRYSRAVVCDALRRRKEGESSEGCAASCTSGGTLDASTVKRWGRRFELVGGALSDRPPETPFRRDQGRAIVGGPPAGSRNPDPSQEDPWARSPPQP